LGIGLYFIPLAMIANKTILQLSSDPFLAIIAFIKIAISLVFLSFSIISKSNLVLKLFCFVLSIFIMFY
jgi:hypothetical protein